MKHLIFLLLLSLLFVSCQTVEKPFLSNYLNTGNLPQQSFTINPDADTTLTSSGGVKIRIDKGTFPSGKPVIIEWKEALDFQSILKAGLTTQTGKELLRSGGMFYFNTKEKLDILKPIGIDLPTETIAAGMQLYKGDSSEGKLDWRDPKPIENVTKLKENLYGKALFENNCTSCHKVDKDLTGPSLMGITERRSKQWLYAVIRNAGAMSQFDPVICCQKAKYGVIMQSFVGLSFAEMDSIYAHINYQTQNLKDKSAQGFGCDNCVVTDPTYDSLLFIYNKTYYSNLIKHDYAERDTLMQAELLAPDVIASNNVYQVTIQSPGWYNIDALLKEWSETVPSNLVVYPKGERNIEMEHYLVIPAMKIFVNGTVQSGGETVVFDEPSGKIPLPQERGAFIIGVGSADGKYFFAKKEFITATSLVVDLPVQAITKEQFEARMNELSYYGLNTKTEALENKWDTATVVPKNSKANIPVYYNDSLSMIIMQLRKITAKKMKECGCERIDGTATDNTVYDYVQGVSSMSKSDSEFINPIYNDTSYTDIPRNK